MSQVQDFNSFSFHLRQELLMEKRESLHIARPAQAPLHGIARQLFIPGINLCSRHYTPGPNLVISVAGEQSLAIGTPSQANTLGIAALSALVSVFGLELIDLALLLQVEDGDAGCGGGAEPVAVRREDEGVDFVTGMKRVEVFRFVKVPEHGDAVLSARGAERAIGGDGDGVDVAGVTNVVGLDAASGKIPYLANCMLATCPYTDS